MIEILQEITDWGEDKVSNNTYFVKSLLDPCSLVSQEESLKN